MAAILVICNPLHFKSNTDTHFSSDHTDKLLANQTASPRSAPLSKTRTFYGPGNPRTGQTTGRRLKLMADEVEQVGAEALIVLLFSNTAGV